MNKETVHYEEIKNKSMAMGAVLFGVADIEPLKSRFLLSNEEIEYLRFGISIALPLSRSILQGIDQRPTLLYKWHYRQANVLLDRIAFDLSLDIMRRGFEAIPIPASQVVDWENQKGHVSHRAVAEAAGLGWRGRNNLLVNTVYGSQIRLVTILTSLPLKTDIPVPFQCGTCRQCIEACPVHALGETPEEYHYHHCFQLLESFSRLRGIGVHICGLCVKACRGIEDRNTRD